MKLQKHIWVFFKIKFHALHIILMKEEEEKG